MNQLLNESLQAIRLRTLHETVINNPYIPHKPTDKQFEFLLYSDILEGFYGGAAGGGKSDAILMAALQFVQIPKYSALILRRTYADLALPEALMDRAQEWLAGTNARWHADTKTWTFPTGSTLTFGYLDYERSKYRYQGAAFQFISFDEVTQFSEPMYQYLFSRLRRLEDSCVPIRMRAASNPGDIGHDWVKRRWILPSPNELQKENRFFVPAFLEDNPHLDTASYEVVLGKLDPVTREQLRRGNWDVGITGKVFRRGDFKIVESGAIGDQVRFWDLAATEEEKGKDPDWTVGCLMSEHGGKYWVKDVIRVREEAGEVERIIGQTAQIDGVGTRIFMEQEGGASGKSLISHYARNVLRGYPFEGVVSTGSKPVRARPLAAAVSNGNVYLLLAGWNSEFIGEAEQFPTSGVHDDQVDAASQAFNLLFDPNAPIDSPLPTPSGGVQRFAPS